MNWNDKTIFTGDNLPIMRGMNSNSVDLIYLDPPFNSKANYAAPIGSSAAGAEFKDTWSLSDVDITWLDLIENKYPKLNQVIHAAMSNSDKSYLIYMAVRLLEMHRLIKSTGSIYLHCDPTMSHYLKLVMDAIFKKTNFKNEIIWCFTGNSTAKRQFPQKHNIILLYNQKGATFNIQYIPYAESTLKRYNHIDADGRRYKMSTLRSGLQKVYAKEGKPLEDWWIDIPVLRKKKEKISYPTQKPLPLLERIIKASSNHSDIVFDPFCGCATTLVAADRLQRQWVGIDISPKAAELVVERIKDDQGLFRNITHRKDIPQRTDLGNLPPYNCSENKQYLYGVQGGDCNGCKEHFRINNLEVDHLIATSVGGTDHLQNLQLLCGHCNRIKGDRGQEYLLNKLAER